MAVRFRPFASILAGVALAMIGAAAAARDYVVVSSTDPAVVRGQRRVFVFAGGESNPPTGGLMSIDPAAATAARFDVTGTATIASGAKIELDLGSLLRDPREFEILRAGTLT